MVYRLRNWLYITLGLLCVLVGLIGVVLPVLPTTPFMILAAFCFSRSSERLHAWLLSQKVIGPMVRDWEEHRVICFRAKVLSTALILLLMSYPLFWGPLSGYAKIGLAVVMCGVLTFIWSCNSTRESSLLQHACRN